MKRIFIRAHKGLIFVPGTLRGFSPNKDETGVDSGVDRSVCVAPEAAHFCISDFSMNDNSIKLFDSNCIFGRKNAKKSCERQEMEREKQ